MKQMIRAVAVAPYFALSLYSFGAIAQDAAAAAPSMTADLVSLILPLVVVIAAGVAALWFVKRRYAGTGGNDALRIRSVLAVGPRERIVLVETERQVLVVGVCATSMSTLAQWSQERPKSDTQL